MRLRDRRRKYRLPLPSIVFGNAQSIRNKTDELEANVKFYHEFREANLMCLSETWLTENDGDPEIPGFTVVRGDRSLDETGKAVLEGDRDDHRLQTTEETSANY